MKQFNLEEFEKNPNRKVVTRNGTPVRIICTDSRYYRPIIVLAAKADGTERIKFYPKNGKCSYSPLDLLFDNE